VQSLDADAAQPETRGADAPEVIIVTGSCCTPMLGPIDEGVRRSVQDAVARSEVNVSLKEMSLVQALAGGLPTALVADLAARLRGTGRPPVPAVLVDGRPVGTGVPTADELATAIRDASRIRLEAGWR
jgi:hypothetical protein